jgi:hypothetical protein
MRAGADAHRRVFLSSPCPGPNSASVPALSIVPSPSNTCGNSDCSLDFAESVLERKDLAPLVLALDSGTYRRTAGRKP